MCTKDTFEDKALKGQAWNYVKCDLGHLFHCISQDSSQWPNHQKLWTGISIDNVAMVEQSLS